MDRNTRLALTLILPLCFGVAPADEEPAPAKFTNEQLQFFEKEIRPRLAAHCYQCHSADAKRIEGSLLLDRRAGHLKGGDSGAAIEVGDSENSLLISALTYESFEMPPKGRLAKADVDAFRKWIDMGAPWPDETAAAVTTDKEEFDWKARRQAHWAWQPLGNPVPPANGDPLWNRSPIDQFIFAKLSEAGLQPSPRADRETLIRRVTLDLTGLPPSPEEVHAFVNDESDDAYERLVDRLLTSPHFGEKFARHWMDLVRYAESHGHEFDYDIPHVVPYRDYLIEAFNDDLPYDRFVTEHIAGDLLDERHRSYDDHSNASVVPTAFWYLGEATHAPTDSRKDEADRIDNQIDVFSKTFLGMTVSCARCHDHKFDPIPTTDYYALAGVMQSTRRRLAMPDPGGRIENARQQLAELSRNGTRALLESQPWNMAREKEIRDELLAARAVYQRQQSAGPPASEAQTPPRPLINEVAAARAVDPERLAGWVTLIDLATSAAPDHPAKPLAVFGPQGLADFARYERQVADTLRKQAESAKNYQERTELLFDCEHPLGDWFAEGPAFDEPTSARPRWDVRTGVAQLTEPGTASGSRLSANLEGVLRSPTFTMPERLDLRFRAGGDVTIRLIIDGYFLEPRNGLLFGGTRLDPKKCDTKGEWQWRTMQNDLQTGRSCWLEVHVGRGGWIDIDEVRLNNGRHNIASPSDVVARALFETPSESPEAFATKWAQAWTRLARELSDGNPSGDAVRLANLIADTNLITTPQALTALAAERQRIEQPLPRPQRILAATDGTGEDGRVFIRGSHENLGEAVPRRLPLVVGGEDQPTITEGSGRLELARRMLADDSPLPPRVMVNRLWHWLMGRGIVPTVDDFGKMGQPPSHPELLDWLARDFRDGSDWSVKAVVRTIVLSETYRQASRLGAEHERALEVDPTNRLRWRMPVRRMTAEQIRDSILAISGRLDRNVGGGSVPVHLTPYMNGRGRPGRSGPLDGNGRRSLYIAIRRNFLPSLLLAFDFPVPSQPRGRRTVSNVPAQALVLMNNPFVVEQARLWATQLLTKHETDDARLDAAFLAAFARSPSVTERRLLTEFLSEPGDEKQAWADVCHMLLNRKEFLFVR